MTLFTVGIFVRNNLSSGAHVCHKIRRPARSRRRCPKYYCFFFFFLPRSLGKGLRYNTVRTSGKRDRDTGFLLESFPFSCFCSQWFTIAPPYYRNNNNSCDVHCRPESYPRRDGPSLFVRLDHFVATSSRCDRTITEDRDTTLRTVQVRLGSIIIIIIILVSVIISLPPSKHSTIFGCPAVAPTNNTPGTPRPRLPRRFSLSLAVSRRFSPSIRLRR